jgi:pimeloyl-ACP methyl ester carboxylesterase
MALNLIRIQGTRAPVLPPVLLVHGAGVRANLFRAPIERTIVDELIDRGYDVWLENWRASIDVPPNLWTLDQAAVYDHPRAVQTIVRETGCSEVKAIIHCQGSTSFMMSAAAGLVPEVSTIVTNAVSLHPVVPESSRLKILFTVPMVKRFTDYLDPQWGLKQPDLFTRALNAFVQATHRECDNAVCKWISFTYGTGFPTLWSHEHLTPETHEWIKQEFAKVPLRFFEQMGACLKKGHLISWERFPELPADFVAQPPRTKARFAFFAGENNRCFLAESQTRTFDYVNRIRSGFHTLRTIPNYGHLDVFLGKDAARDVFPLMLEELER